MDVTAYHVFWATLCMSGIGSLTYWAMLSPQSDCTVIRWLVAITLSLVISVRGMRRNSLDFSGGMLSIVIGLLLTITNAAFFSSMIAFYLSSSALTKWKSAEKKKIEEDFKEGMIALLNYLIVASNFLLPTGGQRNWVQVWCNGGIGSVCALFYLYNSGIGERPINLTGPEMDAATLYSLGYVASISCSCGDTWASEVGSAVGGSPRLITTLKSVPRGTNGGVTMIGLACSLTGGLFIGISYYISLLLFSATDSCTPQWSIVIIAGIAGLLGSLIDSLLGATVQYSGYSEEIKKVVGAPGADVKHISGCNIIGNHAVNFFSALLTGMVVLYIAQHVVICY